MSGCGADRGPKMLMNPGLHREKKPDWIRVRLPHNPAFWSTKSLITDLKLVTVCEEAQCPNRWECWGQGTATFMIAGEKCTRACGFCAVKTAKPEAPRHRSRLTATGLSRYSVCLSGHRPEDLDNYRRVH